LIAALLLFVILSVILGTRRNVTAGLNVPIRYDDFVFTVTSAEKAIPFRDDPKAARALVEYRVALQVTNRAKRVNFQFRDGWAVLFDQSGRSYPASADVPPPRDGEAPSGPTAVPLLPPGASLTRQLVFRVPAYTEWPRLRIMMGGRVGDVLETMFFGRKQFQLP
jgi:hypothetical protein